METMNDNLMLDWGMLPATAIGLIGRMLPPRDLLSFSRVNKHFNQSLPLARELAMVANDCSTNVLTDAMLDDVPRVVNYLLERRFETPDLQLPEMFCHTPDVELEIYYALKHDHWDVVEALDHLVARGVLDPRASKHAGRHALEDQRRWLEERGRLCRDAYAAGLLFYAHGEELAAFLEEIGPDVNTLFCRWLQQRTASERERLLEAAGTGNLEFASALVEVGGHGILHLIYHTQIFSYEDMAERAVIANNLPVIRALALAIHRRRNSFSQCAFKVIHDLLFMPAEEQEMHERVFKLPPAGKFKSAALLAIAPTLSILDAFDDDIVKAARAGETGSLALCLALSRSSRREGFIQSIYNDPECAPVSREYLGAVMGFSKHAGACQELLIAAIQEMDIQKVCYALVLPQTPASYQAAAALARVQAVDQARAVAQEIQASGRPIPRYLQVYIHRLNNNNADYESLSAILQQAGMEKYNSTISIINWIMHAAALSRGNGAARGR